jgi:hypothetical protein
VPHPIDLPNDLQILLLDCTVGHPINRASPPCLYRSKEESVSCGVVCVGGSGEISILGRSLGWYRKGKRCGWRARVEYERLDEHRLEEKEEARTELCLTCSTSAAVSSSIVCNLTTHTMQHDHCFQIQNAHSSGSSALSRASLSSSYIGPK